MFLNFILKLFPDGNWTRWTPWTTCTRKCGGGVQSRLRSCTNPQPSSGGQYCVGKASDTRMCNTQECAGMFEALKVAIYFGSVYCNIESFQLSVPALLPYKPPNSRVWLTFGVVQFHKSTCDIIFLFKDRVRQRLRLV